MQGTLKLEAQSRLMAKAVCRKVAAGLHEIASEREQILSHMHLADLCKAGKTLNTPDVTAKNLFLMDQVSALAENAMMQKEMARHAVRVFTWQICSPAMLGDLVAHLWPIFPHFHAAVYAAAAEA